MTKRLHRAQILLEPEQHQALRRIAQQENRSISEVVREIIREWFAIQHEEIQWRRRMSAVEELKLIRESVQKRYGVIQEDLVAEVREDRDLNIDRVIKEAE